MPYDAKPLRASATPDTDPEQQRAAALAVACRTHALGFSRADTLEVLQALGLTGDVQGTKTDPIGRRIGAARGKSSAPATSPATRSPYTNEESA